MLGNRPIPTNRFASAGTDRQPFERQPYLATHRALAACTREFSRLSTDVVRGAAALHADGVAVEKPVVRQSPGRCIVQLGPVAVTLAWLRSTVDSPADGELLVIVWRGAVAPRGDHIPERAPTPRSAAPAVALREESFVAEAESEESWTWRQPKRADAGACSSAELAARCVERLRLAHAESLV